MYIMYMYMYYSLARLCLSVTLPSIDFIHFNMPCLPQCANGGVYNARDIMDLWLC